MKPAFFVAMGIFCGGVAWGDDADELARLRAENAALRGEVASLRAEIAALRGQQQQLVEQKRQLTALAGVASDGTLVDQARARIRTSVEGDRTTLTTQPLRVTVVRGSRADHFLSATVSYGTGQTPDHVTLFLQTRYSTGEYRDVKTLTLVIGEQTYDLPVTQYKTLKRAMRAGNTARNLEDETLTITLPWATATKLAQSQRVTGRLGAVEIALDRDDVAMFGALRARVAGGGETRER